MLKLILLSSLIFSLVLPYGIKDKVPGNIKLIQGFKHKNIPADDALCGEIYKEHGLVIKYEMGGTQGAVASPHNKKKYKWYKEQIINNRQVNCALTENDDLIVSFILGPNPETTTNVANFTARINSPEDLADALLMILTFDSRMYQ